MISNYAPLLELYSFILMPLPDQGGLGGPEGPERARDETPRPKAADGQPFLDRKGVTK